jgi:hypothetical protein
MSNDLEPGTVFPTSILTGSVVVSLIVMIVLTVFVFGMGGHGTTQQAANAPAATQPKR